MSPIWGREWWTIRNRTTERSTYQNLKQEACFIFFSTFGLSSFCFFYPFLTLSNLSKRRQTQTLECKDLKAEVDLFSFFFQVTLGHWWRRSRQRHSCEHKQLPPTLLCSSWARCCYDPYSGLYAVEKRDTVTRKLHRRDDTAPTSSRLEL
ncbi:hypothetical protein B0H65DRAFT_337708 [Neurospora tetraspora]|uniref:Uncharacterized protein n=1 Tax=Neurospora tetraspora TaxID=94610 RepID=A0AAE0J1F5_9PEZI|nr:hypothetical protein B0H65DRAFT_337708 [Neurospora tetraspora]